jgi:hypothetical protein
MWDRWQKGDSMRVIAGLFDRGHSSVQRIFSEARGIRPQQRSRSRLALNLSEREEISRGDEYRKLGVWTSTYRRAPILVR